MEKKFISGFKDYLQKLNFKIRDSLSVATALDVNQYFWLKCVRSKINFTEKHQLKTQQKIDRMAEIATKM